jgi:hypothetical protein
LKLSDGTFLDNPFPMQVPQIKHLAEVPGQKMEALVGQKLSPRSSQPKMMMQDESVGGETPLLVKYMKPSRQAAI